MRRRHLVGPGAALVALALVIQLGRVAPWAHLAGAERSLDRAEPVTAPDALAVPQTELPVTTAAPTTTAPTTVPPPPPAPPQRFSLEPCRGLGAWIDVYASTSTVSYDLRTTTAPHWPVLLPFRDLRPGCPEVRRAPGVDSRAAEVAADANLDVAPHPASTLPGGDTVAPCSTSPPRPSRRRSPPALATQTLE